MKCEYIGGLPFYEPSNERRIELNIGEVVEELINYKREFGISYPRDAAINDACNILSRLPRDKKAVDWIIENGGTE
ncbi:hypothetical protein SAMN05443270_3130 [Lacrimispora sphenoides]|nr:hypothetical protein SAMN05443270_3130 [Lacrimispora sphenoides]